MEKKNEEKKKNGVVVDHDHDHDQQVQQLNYSNPFSPQKNLQEINFLAKFKPYSPAEKSHCKINEPEQLVLFNHLVYLPKTRRNSKGASNSKKRKSAELSLHDYDKRKKVDGCGEKPSIRLFGVDIFVDDHDHKNREITIVDDQKGVAADEEEKRKSKGKEKIIYDDQQPSVDPLSVIVIQNFVRKGIIINEDKDKEKRVYLKVPRPKKPQKQYDDDPTPPLLPPSIIQQIKQDGGSEPVFLASKKLFQSDVNVVQNRLNITESQKLLEALTKDEKQLLESKDGVQIATIDESGGSYKLRLKRWRRADMIVLIHEWNELTKANKLKNGDWVYLWGYRQNSKFCLAVNVRRGNSIGESSGSGHNGTGNGGGVNGGGSGSTVHGSSSGGGVNGSSGVNSSGDIGKSSNWGNHGTGRGSIENGGAGRGGNSSAGSCSNTGGVN